MATLTSFVCVLTILGIFANAAAPTARVPQNDLKKVIRLATADTLTSLFKGDVESFKRRVVHRTLDFVAFDFELLREDAASNKQLREAGVAGEDQFLELIIQGAVSAYTQNTGIPPEESVQARVAIGFPSSRATPVADVKVADVNLRFRAVRVENDWGIDPTDMMKKALLDGLRKAELREEIKNF